MLKPESLKAKPADNYEDLKRQFFALKALCESKINQCSIYAKKLAEYDRESIVAGSESLNSEREMNAQLTGELERANERVAELEKNASLFDWSKTPEGTQSLRINFDGEVCDIGCFDGAGNIFSCGDWEVPAAPRYRKLVEIPKQLHKGR